MLLNGYTIMQLKGYTSICTGANCTDPLLKISCFLESLLNIVPIHYLVECVSKQAKYKVYR